jgi:hypothetical protein
MAFVSLEPPCKRLAKALTTSMHFGFGGTIHVYVLVHCCLIVHALGGLEGVRREVGR